MLVLFVVLFGDKIFVELFIICIFDNLLFELYMDKFKIFKFFVKYGKKEKYCK